MRIFQDSAVAGIEPMGTCCCSNARLDGSTTFTKVTRPVWLSNKRAKQAGAMQPTSELQGNQLQAGDAQVAQEYVSKTIKCDIERTSDRRAQFHIQDEVVINSQTPLHASLSSQHFKVSCLGG